MFPAPRPDAASTGARDTLIVGRTADGDAVLPGPGRAGIVELPDD